MQEERLKTREIKFRAWDKQYKKMASVVKIHFNNEQISQILINYYYTGNIWEGCLVYVEPNEVELMQFTGLVDKNGKEIYEGDIVRFSDGKVANVIWNDMGHGCWWFTDSNGKFFERVCLNDLEVIGNVWEEGVSSYAKGLNPCAD